MISLKDSEILEHFLNAGLDFKNAIDKTNNVSNVVEKMQNGIAAFKYIKCNGDVRYAVGTLEAKLIPTEKLPKGTKKTPPSDNLQTYFDLTVGDWRAFDLSRYDGQI